MNYWYRYLAASIPLLLILYQFFSLSEIDNSFYIDIPPNANYCEAEFRKEHSLPVGYKISKLHIFHRHGDRSPLHGLPFENVTWSSCSDVHEVMSLSGSKQNSLSASREFERVVDIPSTFQRGYWNGNCNPGQLTDRGYKQMRMVGQHFHDIYIRNEEKWVKAPKPDEIFVRSTDVWRTIQSTQSLVSGLFPTELYPTKTPIKINVRPKSIDPLSVSISHCPKHLKKLLDLQKTSLEFQKFTQIETQILKSLIVITSAVNFNLDNFNDLLQCRKCHKKPMPCNNKGDGCINEELRLLTEKLNNYRFNFDFGGDVMGALRAGPILYELGYSNKKISVYSSHDTTLLALLSALEIDVKKEWPPYASTLVLEVLGNSDGEEVVRALYNGKVFPIGWCDGQVLCPINVFNKKVESFGKLGMDC